MTDDPLTRPVLLYGVELDVYERALIKPADVLAALDDEQREALVQRVSATLAVEFLGDGGSDPDAARAVVDAICGEQA